MKNRTSLLTNTDKKISEIINPSILHERNIDISPKKSYRDKKEKFVFRNYLSKAINFFSKLKYKENKYFFIATYLSFFSEVKLNVKLGQFPRFWKSIDIQREKVRYI